MWESGTLMAAVVERNGRIDDTFVGRSSRTGKDRHVSTKL